MSDITFIMDRIGNVPEIQEMISQYKREMIRRNMDSGWPNSDIYHFAAIYLDGKPLSMVCFAPIKAHETVYITGAYTEPTWRRLGIYETLMRECINQWRLDGCYKVLRSGFNKKNEISKLVQEKRGAKVDEERENCFRTTFSLEPTGEEWELTPDLLKPLLDRLEPLTG